MERPATLAQKVVKRVGQPDGKIFGKRFTDRAAAANFPHIDDLIQHDDPPTFLAAVFWPLPLFLLRGPNREFASHQ